VQFVPCVLCGDRLEKRESKRSKPYFHCDSCGTQFFVRRKEGIERLEKLMLASERNALVFEQAAKRVFEVQALLSEIDGTKAQIRKLDFEIGIFFRDDDKTRARKSLKTRLENFLLQLDAFAKKSAR
jgi:hypothetical protein